MTLLRYELGVNFPLLAGAFGPISTLFSIAALVESWTNIIDNDSGKKIKKISDFHWIIILNSLSLGLGVIANSSLLVNFTGRASYKICMSVSIIGWYLAFAILIIIVPLFNSSSLSPSGSKSNLELTYELANEGNSITYTEAYWYACVTSILYFICASLLSCTFIASRKHRITFLFLDKHQRSLMMQNMLLVAWLAIGAGIFSSIDPLVGSYSNGLYFVTVTILTLGLGDIVPSTTASRIFNLPYALFGILFVGLIVTSISNIVLHPTQQLITYLRITSQRRKYLPLSNSFNTLKDKQDQFNLVRQIQSSSFFYRKVRALLISFFIFLIFWLIGAEIFSVTQGLEYFPALYFCMMCLLTVGYGDFTMSLPASRVLFETWVLLAVPLMTILTTHLCDTLISSYSIFWDFLVLKTISSTDQRKHNLDSDDDKLAHSDYDVLNDAYHNSLLYLYSTINPKLSINYLNSDNPNDNYVNHKLFNLTQNTDNKIENQSGNQLKNSNEKNSYLKTNNKKNHLNENNISKNYAIEQSIIPEANSEQTLDNDICLSTDKNALYSSISQKYSNIKSYQEDIIRKTAPQNSQDILLSSDNITWCIYLLSQIRKHSNILKTTPKHKYTFDQWQTMIHDTDPPPHISTSSFNNSTNNLAKEQNDSNSFRNPHLKMTNSRIVSNSWLDDRSPLNWPLDEPQYFVQRYINALEFQLNTLLPESENANNSLNKMNLMLLV